MDFWRKSQILQTIGGNMTTSQLHRALLIRAEAQRWADTLRIDHARAMETVRLIERDQGDAEEALQAAEEQLRRGVVIEAKPRALGIR
jgi:hypothetical protein